MAEGFSTILLVATPGLPALLTVAWVLPRLRSYVVGLIPWAAAPAVALALLHISAGAAPSVELPLLATGVRLHLDGIGSAFLLLTGVLWLAAGVFARSYHADDPERGRFFLFFALTMTGNLGVPVAGEMLSFYLFFSVMTFSAYGLVVHRRNAAAKRAGRIYIALAFGGEVAMLSGLLTLAAVAGGSTAFGLPLEEVWARLADGPVVLDSVPLVAGLLLGGLAVKVGIVPVHLWLPLAHPIAPTAASALLSGAMVKAGVLGWLRFAPYGIGAPGVGAAFLLAGVATAFYGVIVGVAQDDPKTVLAYSTVSQMGYLAMAFGTVLLIPEATMLGIVAVVLYALHHGLAKGALFLSVGVVDRLPGASSGWGWAVAVGVAWTALALAGLPLSTGAQAKGALKAALGEVGGAWYSTLDPILILAAAGTTILLVRFAVTLRRRASRAEPGTGGTPWGLLLPFGGLVVASALGFLWIPTAFSPPAGTSRPGPFDDLATAIVPIALAGALGWAVYRRPRWLGTARHVRLPEGDLVVLLEMALGQLPCLRAAGPSPAAQWVTNAVSRVGARLRRAADLLASRDRALLRGVSLGSLLFALATLLALALS